MPVGGAYPGMLPGRACGDKGPCRGQQDIVGQNSQVFGKAYTDGSCYWHLPADQAEHPWTQARSEQAHQRLRAR